MEESCPFFKRIRNEHINFLGSPVHNHIHFSEGDAGIIGHRLIVEAYHLLIVDADESSPACPEQYECFSILPMQEKVRWSLSAASWSPRCRGRRMRTRMRDGLLLHMRNYMLILMKRILTSLQVSSPYTITQDVLEDVG